MSIITGHKAIEAAELDATLVLRKYTDPTEAAREGLTIDEAKQIAAEDPGLIWTEAPYPKTDLRFDLAVDGASYSVRIDGSEATIVQADGPTVTAQVINWTLFLRNGGQLSDVAVERIEDEIVRLTVPAPPRPVVECAYCARDVADHAAEPPPALDDDAAWADLAKEHAADCEWITTRAHRRAAS